MGGSPVIWSAAGTDADVQQDLVKGSDATMLSNMLNNDLPSYAQDAVNAGASSNATALLQILQIQRDWILNKNAGISESFDYTFGTTLGYDSWYLLPFGRGSVKITSNQPYASSYSIDPRYFSNSFDRLAQGATARFTRNVSDSSPLEGYVNSESAPGTATVGQGSSLNQWAAWVQRNYRSNWHPIGTAAMMSKSLGGVVDSRNKVVSDCFEGSGLRSFSGVEAQLGLCLMSHINEEEP